MHQVGPKICYGPRELLGYLFKVLFYTQCRRVSLVEIYCILSQLLKNCIILAHRMYVSGFQIDDCVFKSCFNFASLLPDSFNNLYQILSVITSNLQNKTALEKVEVQYRLIETP